MKPIHGPPSARFLPWPCLLLLLAWTTSATAQTLTVLHDFSGFAAPAAPDGSYPAASLISSNNILYGTAEYGGSSGNGTVFAVHADGTDFTTLHGFSQTTAPVALTNKDGANPAATLVVANNALYGTTEKGGSAGWGTVFAANLDGTGMRTLHGFTNGMEGSTPAGGLVLVGNTLYGTTEDGGKSYGGTIFAIQTDGKDFATLYAFTNGVDGGYPAAGLVAAGDTLYGTTQDGGTNYAGTIFAIPTNGSDFKVVHTFNFFNGAQPEANLTLSGNTLYGTTSAGGDSFSGTVFAVNTDGSNFTNIYSFQGETNGAQPQTAVVVDGGVLYGTTSTGGGNDAGNVFAVNISGANYRVLHSFTGGDDGLTPAGNLFLTNNTLYGTAEYAGAGNNGVIFSIDTSGAGFTNLYSFTGGDDGGNPVGGLAGDTLYGTTFNGGAAGDGALFAIHLDGTGFTNLHSFLPPSVIPFGVNSDGANPAASLILSANTLYGTAKNGGTSGNGTIFAIQIDGSGFTNLHNFGAGVDGAMPSANLLLLGNTLYGTTEQGGRAGNGTIFSMSLDGSDFKVLYRFSGSPDGSLPIAGLIASGTTLYGTTMSGGRYYGTIFAIQTNGTGFTNLYTFTGGVDGNSPWGALTLSGDMLFGTAETGGTTGWGTVFSIQTNGSNFMVLHPFTGAPDGGNSFSTLLLKGNTLYGTAYTGGSATNYGLIFTIQTDGLGYSNIFSFSSQIGGANPFAGVILVDGLLYGTASAGGTAGSGAIFSVQTNGDGFLTRHSFNPSPVFGPQVNSDGAYPFAGLLLSGSTLYGTAQAGGNAGYGTVFSLQSNGSNFITLYNFTNGSDGAFPAASVILSGNALYSTASGGGTGKGTIFALNTNGNGFTNLHSFLGGSDGAYPVGSLLLWNDTLYGTTQGGGSSSKGTVFSIGIDGSSYTILYNFTGGNDGANPLASLIVWSNSWLIGTASASGSSNNGTLFALKVSPVPGPAKLGGPIFFSSPFPGGMGGGFPEGTPVLMGNGTLVFTSGGNGIPGAFGTIGTCTFSDTTGFGGMAFTPCTGTGGAGPDGGVCIFGGNAWFAAPSDGAGNGALCVFNFNNSTLVDGFNFNGTDGGAPTGNLINVGGSVDGAAGYGGTSDHGTLFSLTPCTGDAVYTAPLLSDVEYGTEADAALTFTFTTDLPAPTPYNMDTPLTINLYGGTGADPSSWPVLTTFSENNTAGGTLSFNLDLTVLNPPAGIAVGFSTPCGQSLISSVVDVPPVGLPPTMPPGMTAGNFTFAGNSGCPVSTFTGELFEILPPDLQLRGPMSLQFQRYYAASIKRDGFITGRLGDNWLHNFDMLLTPASSNLVEVITQFGRVIQFTNTGAGYSLVGHQDIPYQLTNSASGFILGDPYFERLYTFDNSGQLTHISDGRGNVHTLSYTGNLLATVSDGLGHSLTFQYNGDGQLTSVGDGTRTITFTQTGTLLTQSSDALGNVTTYSYDDKNAISGLLTAAEQPRGNVPFSQVFNSSGQVVTQVEAGAVPGTNTFVYDTNKTILTDPLGFQWQDTHTPLGQLAKATDQAGKTISMTYNAAGQRASETDRLGTTTSFGYHAGSGKMSALTNNDGSITTFRYAGRTVSGLTLYDLAQVTYPDTSTESYTYDAQGNVLSLTDRAGEVWQYTYNNRGQMLTTTLPTGGRITATYNADGTAASRTDSDTGVTQFRYDQFRRLTNVINPDLTTSSKTYDADDRLTSTTDELGRVNTYSYDGNGKVRQMTDPAGKSDYFAYDARNRLLRVTNRVQAVTSMIYDSRGLLVTNISPTGDLTVFSYDSRRRPSTATDPIGNNWQTGYDNEALLASATNPLSQVSTVARNSVGAITNAADPLNHATTFNLDSMQQLTEGLDPLQRSNTWSYDSRGLLASAGREGLGTAFYQLNSLGFISNLTDLGGHVWSFNYTPMGRSASVTDPLNRTRHFAYDTRGRLERLAFADGSSCTNTYDAVGNPIRYQYSDGTDLPYTYDSLNRGLTAGDLGFSYDAEGRLTNTASSGADFGASYDASGRLTAVSYYNGRFSVLYSYDARSLLTNVTDTLTGASVSYVYDAACRLTGVTRGNGVNGSYTYDEAGRLTSLQEGTIIKIQFGQDDAGQITNETATAPLDPGAFLAPAGQNFSYDAAHQIASSGYAYDARGRLTAAPGHKFVWDDASRMVGIDDTTLTYNGVNRVLTRNQNGGITLRYFYNRAIRHSPIMAERTEPILAVTRYYVWTPDGRLLYMIDPAQGNAVFYFHFDQIGSTLALTGPGGQVSDSYAYTPYGVLLAHSGTSTQPFTYIGQMGVRSEPSAGLYDMRARFYDPASARFLSPDPVWPRMRQPDALDPYEYAWGNPTIENDPTGLCEGGGGIFVTGTTVAVGGTRAAVNYFGEVAQTGANLANSEAVRVAGGIDKEITGWFEGFVQGTIAEESGTGELIQTIYSEEEAVQRVNFMFGAPPGNPFGENAGLAELFTPQAELNAKRFWYANGQSEVTALEEEGVALSGKASALGKVSTGLAVVGVALQTGTAIYEDVKNGAGVAVTANDAGATVAANVLVLAVPGAGLVDGLSGGTISGVAGNALKTPGTIARVVLGRVTTRDADAIRGTYGHFAVGRWILSAGDWLIGD